MVTPPEPSDLVEQLLRSPGYASPFGFDPLANLDFSILPGYADLPPSITGLLYDLDQLDRGRYAQPTADANATELSTLNDVQGLQFVTNAGRGASSMANQSGFVPYVEGTGYRVINERGDDEVVFSGTGQEGLLGAYNVTQNLSATEGTKANWKVEMQDPRTGLWFQVADDDPKGLGVGEIVGTLLPLAAIPLTGGLSSLGIAGVSGLTGTAAAIGTSAALGGLGAALAGRDPLTGAVLGGAGAAGGRLIGGALQAGGGLGTNLGANAATAIGTGIGTAAGGVVTGQSLQDAIINGVASGALSYVAGELFNNVTGERVTDADLAQLQDDFDAVFGTSTPGTSTPGTSTPGTSTPGTSSFSPDTGITVSANPRVNAAVNVMLRTGGGSVSDPAFRDLTPEEFAEAQRIYDEQASSNDIVVEKEPFRINILNTGVDAGSDTSIYDSTSNDIVVEGERSNITNLLNTPIAGLAGTGALINSILNSAQTQNALNQIQNTDTTTSLTGNETIDDILRYSTLAGLGIDVAGSLLGGGSGSGGTATPYTPVLGAVPQFTRGALVPYAGDYETYATRPEHAFFENMTGVLPTTTTPITTTPTTTTPTTTTPTTTTPTTTTPTTTTPTYTPLITGTPTTTTPTTTTPTTTTPTVQAPIPATQDLTPSPIPTSQMTNYYSQFGQGLADIARQYGITSAQFNELWQPVAQARGYNAQGSLQQSQAIATAMQQAEQGLLNLINQQQAA